jgi:hypothetical protein
MYEDVNKTYTVCSDALGRLVAQSKNIQLFC